MRFEIHRTSNAPDIHGFYPFWLKIMFDSRYDAEAIEWVMNGGGQLAIANAILSEMKRQKDEKNETPA